MSCDDVLSSLNGQNNGKDVALTSNSDSILVLRVSGVDTAPALLSLTWSIALDQGANQIIVGAKRWVRGKIEFGVASISHTVLFDMARGGSLTVPASSLSLYAGWGIPPGVGAPPVRVRASLGYGARPGTIPCELSLTDYIGPLAAGGLTAPQPLPSFSTTVSLMGEPYRPFVLGSVEVILLDLDGFILTRFAPTTLGLADVQRIPTRATHYQIGNTGATALTNVCATFGLSL